MKIAHLADLHLGYRAYHRVTPRGINQREADVADAFRRVVARLVEIRPDLVLVAGDVFHTVRPSNTAIAEAFRQFCALTEQLPGVPVVMIAGNHDSPRSADTGNILSLFSEIDGVTPVYDECRDVRLPELDTTILCMPHVSLAVEHATEMEPDPRARNTVLLLHAEVQGADGEPRYRTEFGGAVVPESAIRPDEWTYVALGHHHIAEPLAPNAWYAGGIERTSSFIWQEKAAKGFLVYDTESRKSTFEAVETRPILDLPWIEGRGLDAAEVDEQIRARVESIAGGVEGKMVRLVVADVTRHVVRELNHRRIREWKAQALHFHLDARPPEVRRRVGSGAPVKRQTLKEQVESWLEHTWKPSRQGIEGPRLVRLGGDYIDRAGEEG